ncbi:MAG: M48 family metallopeptidase [Balneolaceae bacterium]|nr:M48 family metallopeptidase [Balneolaceae bacterium]
MFFKKPTSRIIHTQIAEFQVEVTFKPIKNIYLKVSRSTGKIRVSAPLKTSKKVVHDFVQSRGSWIRNHLSKKVEQRAKQQFVDGELHKYFGVDIPLKVDYVNKNIFAYLHNDGILLRIKENYDAEKREKVLDQLYRKELKKLVGELIKKWEPIMGVEVREFGIKKMKTRWGTCNVRDHRVWINLHLAKEKPEVIELVVVHEMVHLLERLHSKRFYALMDKYLPNHRALEQELDGKVC